VAEPERRGLGDHHHALARGDGHSARPAVAAITALHDPPARTTRSASTSPAAVLTPGDAVAAAQQRAHLRPRRECGAARPRRLGEAEREPERVDRAAVLGEDGAAQIGRQQRLAAPRLGDVEQFRVQPHVRLAGDVGRHLGPLLVGLDGDHASGPPVLDVCPELLAEGREHPGALKRQVERDAARHRLRPDQRGVRPRGARAEPVALEDGDAQALPGELIGHRAAHHAPADDQDIRPRHRRNLAGR
jgi:hypothetical protein